MAQTKEVSEYVGKWGGGAGGESTKLQKQTMEAAEME